MHQSDIRPGLVVAILAVIVAQAVAGGWHKDFDSRLPWCRPDVQTACAVSHACSSRAECLESLAAWFWCFVASGPLDRRSRSAVQESYRRVLRELTIQARCIFQAKVRAGPQTAFVHFSLVCS
jgi:hypothetical protein